MCRDMAVSRLFAGWLLNLRPFNNVLQNEVIKKICLIRKDRIEIPDPPTSVKSCVFTKGIRRFLPINKTGNVEFEMIDTDSEDKNPRRVCMRTAIENVEDCSKGTVTKFRDDLKPRSRSSFSLVKMEICERNSNSSNKSSDTFAQPFPTLSVTVSVLQQNKEFLYFLLWLKR